MRLLASWDHYWYYTPAGPVSHSIDPRTRAASPLQCEVVLRADGSSGGRLTEPRCSLPAAARATRRGRRGAPPPPPPPLPRKSCSPPRPPDTTGFSHSSHTVPSSLSSATRPATLPRPVRRTFSTIRYSKLGGVFDRRDSSIEN